MPHHETDRYAAGISHLHRPRAGARGKRLFFALGRLLIWEGRLFTVRLERIRRQA